MSELSIDSDWPAKDREPNRLPLVCYYIPPSWRSRSRILPGTCGDMKTARMRCRYCRTAMIRAAEDIEIVKTLKSVDLQPMSLSADVTLGATTPVSFCLAEACCKTVWFSNDVELNILKSSIR